MNLPTLDTPQSEIIQYLPSCVWLISLRIMSSRFTHVVAYIRFHAFFLRLNNILLCIYTTFFIYSSVNGNLSYFYLLVRVKSAAMNTVYKHLFKSSFSILLSVYPEDELLDHMVILFTFLRNCHTTFHSGWTILLSYQQCPMFCFIGCKNIYFLRICKILHRSPSPHYIFPT